MAMCYPRASAQTLSKVSPTLAGVRCISGLGGRGTGGDGPLEIAIGRPGIGTGGAWRKTVCPALILLGLAMPNRSANDETVMPRCCASLETVSPFLKVIAPGTCG